MKLKDLSPKNIKKKIEIHFESKKEVGLHAVIEFTQSAVQHCVGGNINKRIYIMQDRYFTRQSFPYSKQKIKELSKRMLVTDRTRGMSIPRGAYQISSYKRIFGRLQLNKF